MALDISSELVCGNCNCRVLDWRNRRAELTTMSVTFGRFPVTSLSSWSWLLISSSVGRARESRCDEASSTFFTKVTPGKTCMLPLMRAARSRAVTVLAARQLAVSESLAQSSAIRVIIAQFPDPVDSSERPARGESR